MNENDQSHIDTEGHLPEQPSESTQKPSSFPTEPGHETKTNKPPISFALFVFVGLLVALADITLYSNQGFAGSALFVLVAPWALLLANLSRKASLPVKRVLAFTLLATALAAVRLIWQGSNGLSWIGLGFVAASAMAMHGFMPYLNDLSHFVIAAPWNGVRALFQSWLRSHREAKSTQSIQGLAILLPLMATLVFAGIFVMANPNLQSIFSQWSNWGFTAVTQWLNQFSLGQAFFWIVTATIAFGFLFPCKALYPIWRDDHASSIMHNEPSSTYAPVRNMLVSVIMLFVIYLAYEFYTLWLLEFPQGFYYAGYAHQGAAWLTAALALATVVLSLAFKENVVADPRIGGLRRLAWIWSALNVLLAIAVYNRLSIYIDFNGMTRMRTVGLFGVTCVLFGFIWVVAKIKDNRSFVWLIQRQLLTLTLMVFAYQITPVDTLVHAYNVKRILQGHFAPSVQITEHPVSNEGVLVLPKLLDCEDEIIREGIRALLAMRQQAVDAEIVAQRQMGWSSYQASSQSLKAHLDSLDAHWQKFKKDTAARDKAYADYKRYAFQWY